MSLYESLPANTLPETPTRSRKAVISFNLGLTSFFLTVLTGVPAIILGLLSLRETRRTDRLVLGKGLAIWGIVLGLVGSLSSGSFLVYAVVSIRRATQVISMA